MASPSPSPPYKTVLARLKARAQRADPSADWHPCDDVFDLLQDAKQGPTFTQPDRKVDHALVFRCLALLMPFCAPAALREHLPLNEAELAIMTGNEAKERLAKLMGISLTQPSDGGVGKLAKFASKPKAQQSKHKARQHGD